MPRQFYACRFHTGDKRDYTYHWDGDDHFEPGTEVKVPDKSGGGWNRVYVVSRSPADFAPTFETKAILGRAQQDCDLPGIAEHLTADEARTLEWLRKEDASAYGECRGPVLNELIAKRLAMVIDDSKGERLDYARVVVTDRGHAVAKAVPQPDLLDGSSGQDRESYSDAQDRESYSA